MPIRRRPQSPPSARERERRREQSQRDRDEDPPAPAPREQETTIPVMRPPDQLWRQWFNNGTGTTTTSGVIDYERVWRSWTTTTTSYTYNASATMSGGNYTISTEPAPEPTDEEREARRQREQERREQWARGMVGEYIPEAEREEFLAKSYQEQTELIERIQRERRAEARRQRWVRDVIRAYPLSEEQQAEFLALSHEAQREAVTVFDREARERANRQRREAQERLDRAHQRGLELLPLVLTDAEYQKYEETGEIFITGSEGGTYEIRMRDHQGNVFWLKDGQRMAALCAHPSMTVGSRENRGRLPDSDAWISQIMALKSDEWQFIVTANVYDNLCGTQEPHERRREANRRVEARRVGEARQQQATPEEQQRRNANAIIAA